MRIKTHAPHVQVEFLKQMQAEELRMQEEMQAVQKKFAAEQVVYQQRAEQVRMHLHLHTRFYPEKEFGHERTQKNSSTCTRADICTLWVRSLRICTCVRGSESLRGH
jgi:hypothetical protein